MDDIFSHIFGGGGGGGGGLFGKLFKTVVLIQMYDIEQLKMK